VKIQAFDLNCDKLIFKEFAN